MKTRKGLRVTLYSVYEKLRDEILESKNFYTIGTQKTLKFISTNNTRRSSLYVDVSFRTEFL